MMENTSINWYAMSDSAIIAVIGQYLRDCRLKQNKTQQQVAEMAGVNRSTVMLLEKGSGGTMASFVQVLRALEQLHVLETFKVERKLTPLQLAKLEKNTRQRASRTLKQ
ncbi:MAG: helix-turn-helix domain-containing protein [Chitinophagales bacterium]